ncbi:MAG: phosphatase [Candidatus Margulisiibacteriota bacterium]
MIKLAADLHTHTISSGHAYATVLEMAKAAAEMGLDAIGIADHGPAMPNGCHDYYFSNMSTLPRELYGIKLYRGAEANIIDLEGNIDIAEIVLPYLDYVIASMHINGVTPEGLTVEENTNMWKMAMDNPFVKILGHPGNPYYPINIEEFVAAAKEKSKIIEINDASFIVRPGSEKILKSIVSEAANQQVMMVINSDAHFINRVGAFDHPLRLIEELKIDEELIINTSIEKIEKYLRIVI